MGKYKLINKFTLISSLFIMLILTTGMSNQNNSFSGKIFKNIYIEQVHVGKMKLDEAKDAVDKKYLLKPIYMKYKDKTTPFFVYCLSGARSAGAVRMMSHMGYENVVDMGGISRYHGDIER